MNFKGRRGRASVPAIRNPRLHTLVLGGLFALALGCASGGPRPAPPTEPVVVTLRPVSAGELLAACRHVEDASSRTYCVATLQGSLSAAARLGGACVPADLDVSDFLAKVFPALEAAPPDSAALDTILHVVAAAWPCSASAKVTIAASALSIENTPAPLRAGK